MFDQDSEYLPGRGIGPLSSVRSCHCSRSCAERTVNPSGASLEDWILSASRSTQGSSSSERNLARPARCPTGSRAMKTGRGRDGDAGAVGEGWMVSNWACATASWVTGSTHSAFTKPTRSTMRSSTRSGGGETQEAVRGEVPPIHDWVAQTAPTISLGRRPVGPIRSRRHSWMPSTVRSRLTPSRASRAPVKLSATQLAVAVGVSPTSADATSAGGVRSPSNYEDTTLSARSNNKGSGLTRVAATPLARTAAMACSVRRAVRTLTSKS
jgi:hypothetical protein